MSAKIEAVKHLHDDLFIFILLFFCYLPNSAIEYRRRPIRLSRVMVYFDITDVAWLSNY